MKKAMMICVVSALIITARAQIPEFKWVTEFGSVEFVYSSNILADANGNLYTLGYYSGKHDFDPGPGIYELQSKGDFDVYLIKTDPGGNFIWAKSFGGAGSEVSFSMDIDADGNVYISGSFEKTADFDPGTATRNITAVTTQDMFICKIDDAGNLVWVIAIPGLSVDCATFLATDDMGNVYMNGNFTGSVDFDPGPGIFLLETADVAHTDVFVLKLDVDGNFIWAKHLPTNNFNTVFSIAADDAGNVYTSGHFDNTIDFDPGPANYLMTAQGNYDAYILKLDANGNFLWVTSVSGPGIDDVFTMTVDDLGNLYAVGNFSGTVDFDPGPAVYNLVNPGDFVLPFILKLDPTGNLVWVTKMSEAMIMDIVAVNSCEIYITGYFSGTLDFDAAISSDDLTANKTDMFVAKYSADGVFEWSQQVTGPGLDYGLSLAVDKYGNVFTTGIFHGTADFDPGTGLYEVTSTGEADVYILKTGICTRKPASTITEKTCKDFTLNNYTYTSSGVYKQTIITADGCDSTVTLDLTISGDSEPSPSLGGDMLLCNGDSITLNAGQFDSYAWSNGSSADRIVVREAGVYAVTVKNSCGSATDQITITSGHCGIFFPTAFTPNNDGVNDVFRTPANNHFFSSYHLVVFNRWGQKVFETSNPDAGWDGRINGIMQTQSTFVWACTYVESANGVKGTKRGTVVLLK